MARLGDFFRLGLPRCAAPGTQGNQSRHYEMDNLAGQELGKSVAQAFIARAQNDGSQ
jgi:hypothetical protein